MPEIIDYTIITGTPREVSDRVLQLTKTGWLLHGPPYSLYHTRTGVAKHCQCMIRYKSDSAIGKMVDLFLSIEEKMPVNGGVA